MAGVRAGPVRACGGRILCLQRRIPCMEGGGVGETPRQGEAPVLPSRAAGPPCPGGRGAPGGQVCSHPKSPPAGGCWDAAGPIGVPHGVCGGYAAASCTHSPYSASGVAGRGGAGCQDLLCKRLVRGPGPGSTALGCGCARGGPGSPPAPVSPSGGLWGAGPAPRTLAPVPAPWDLCSVWLPALRGMLGAPPKPARLILADTSSCF